MEGWTDDMVFSPGTGMVKVSNINIDYKVIRDKEIKRKLIEMDKQKPLTIEDVKKIASDYKK
tara:strand:- start:140 stop:325 length:186 start_codon:yes stop_codon:yes gene_type:complete